MPLIVSTTKFGKKCNDRGMNRFTHERRVWQRQRPGLLGRGGKAAKDYMAF
jgi:hypothetical protein